MEAANSAGSARPCQCRRATRGPAARATARRNAHSGIPPARSPDAPGDAHPPAARDGAAHNAARRRIAGGNVRATSACASTAHSAENRIFRADPDTTRNLRRGERTCFEQAL
jgi:hypothetical protein